MDDIEYSKQLDAALDVAESTPLTRSTCTVEFRTVIDYNSTGSVLVRMFHYKVDKGQWAEVNLSSRYFPTIPKRLSFFYDRMKKILQGD